MLQWVERGMPHRRQIFGGLAHRDATLVIAEHQIEEPMDGVFDRPVPTDRPGERARVPVQTPNIEALLHARLPVDLPLGGHHVNALHLRPASLRIHLGAPLPATMMGFLGLMLIVGLAGKSAGVGVCKGGPNGVVQRLLVALGGIDVVGFALHNHLGRLDLASASSNGAFLWLLQ